jgi:hypothetical protein
MTWKDEIKKEIDDRENYILTAINEGIQIAMRTNKMIRNSKSSEISQADRNLLESSSVELKRAKDRLDKIMRLSPKEPITETRADPEYRD